jgi:RHS repeat-associated protein
MRVVCGVVLKCLTCCLAAFALCTATASAEGSPALGGTGGSPFESPFVVPEALPLTGGQGVGDAEEARRASPEATVAREESQTKYEGLSAEEAAKLAAEVFPGVVDQAAGGPPPLAEGQRITAFISANAAQVTSPSGESGHAVLESMEPIATESSPGQWAPINLSVSEADGGFRVANPAVGVSIPKRLQEGVSVPGSGVSLTPVDGSGMAVGGSEGGVDGSVVFYGGVGVGSDVDEVVKPEPSGFSEDAILRSVASPARLVYRVGLPEGASLVGSSEGSGVAKVVEEGTVIAAVSVPLARDAAGVTVPVSVSVEGDLLVVTVNMDSAEYQYPILVDPMVEDEHINKGSGYTTNWHSKTSEGATHMTVEEKGGWKTSFGSVSEHEWAAVVYTTQGESYIQMLTGSGEGKDSSPYIENWMELISPSSVIESKFALPGSGSFAGDFVCTVEPGCREGKGNSKGSANDSAGFLVNANHTVETRGEFSVQKATVEIKQEKGPEISVDTAHEYVDGGKRNIFYGGGSWLGSKSGGFELHAKDPGIGVSDFYIHAGKGASFFTEENDYYDHSECTGGVQCFPEVNKGYGYESQLPNGEDTLEVYVKDAAGAEAHIATQTIKVDNEPPHNITLSGLPSNHEIDEGQHISLKASAIDGVEGTPSSGMASILLEVDGESISGPQGSCSPGPCTGHAEWTLSAENYAAGEHTLTVVATDNAGNVASETYHLTIHHPESVSVGPGVVNPVTGELSLAATDVSINVPDGALTVSRSYRSRHLAQGTEGPLGRQWNLNLGAQQSLRLVSGGVILTSENGEQIVFESKGKGEFTSPTGDADLTLLEKTVESKTVFTLSSNGSVTTFKLPTGSSGSVWMPASTEGPNGTGKTLYKFKIENGVVEPTEELAPVPAGVSCGEEISELKEGCRALKFEYDEGTTTAKGEKASEWGEYTKHLSKVKFIAWNGSKTKKEPVVAEYAYDIEGRLRAAWNPQITPSPLKTTYGYDTEGHVTAVSTAGHEPQLLEQGTIPGDASPGRLLAVAVPSAETALGSGEAPAIKEVPTLSSTKPVVGTKISVNLVGEKEKTPGTWTGSPLAFIYQWQDCNTEGKECSPIAGAVNQAYYPAASDEGHELVAQVRALNATGATTASTAATSTVAKGTPNTPLPEPPSVGSDAVTTLEYQVLVSGSGAPYEMTSKELATWGQTDDPSEAMAIFPPEKVMGWPADEYKNAGETVYYLDGKDRSVNKALPTGGISVAEYNLYNDVIRTLTPDNRLKAISEGCKAGEECKSAAENAYEEKGAEPGSELLSSLGPQHIVELASGKEGKVNEEALAREHTSYYYNEGAPEKGGPFHLVTKTIDSAETPAKEEYDKRTTETSYSGQSGLGWNLHKPTSVTTDPGGLNLVHTTEYNSSTGAVTETKMPAAYGKDAKVSPTYAAQFGSTGTGGGQLTGPTSVAIDASGDAWVNDREDNRIEEFNSSGTFIQAMGFGVGSKGENKYEICTTSCKEGISGSGSGQFDKPGGISVNQSTGNVYVTDSGNSRIEEFSSSGTIIRSFGSLGTGAEQLSSPTQAAIDSSGNLWVVDYGNSRLAEFSSEGKFIMAAGWGVSNGKSEAETCTTTCQTGIAGSGNGQFFDPQSVAISEGNVYVADRGNNRVEELSSAGKYLNKFGEKGTGNGQFSAPFGISTNPANNNLYVTDRENNRVEEFTPSGSYLLTFGSTGSGTGQFSSPKGDAINSSSEVYVVDSMNNRIEKWVPTIMGNEGAHDTKTIYYTANSEAEVSECREHPAWANLPCETMPAEQPDTSGLPELLTTKYTYNIWDEPEQTTENTVWDGSRTKVDSYDAAGRLKSSSPSSEVGGPLPLITYEYNKETGALEKQNAEAHETTITSVYNRLGQLTSYTDAAKNTSTYEYYTDGLIHKTNDGKGTQTYTYNEAGLPSELVDSSKEGMKFTATYDAEGNILTEGYPNGMTAKYTYNTIGKPTVLEYKKMSHCTEEEKEKCKWFTDTVIPSIHGQWLSQTSTLSKQAYTYDQAGRLTQVQGTPTGGNCTTRIYAYDEDTNRTSLTTRNSSTKECTTEGGTIESHTYDTADRLTGTGYHYNGLGDITTVPELNPEDPELTSTYYVDNQIGTQKQKEQTVGYELDPAGRTLGTISSGKPNDSDITSHYAGPGNTPSWTVNETSREWSRNIPGINGSLAAIQSNAETPELQLTNLHGDIIAKAYMSETATELAAKADTTEYGVPAVSAPAKYSWLGAIQLPTELPSGAILMGARSYIPQLGRFLQPDPIPGGSANAYSYTFGDPINTTDPTGEYVEGAYITAANNTLNREAVERQAAREAEAREAAARAAAEKAAREAAEDAAVAAGPQYGGGEEEWEEWGEEEGGYEYISDHGGKEEHHVEPAILVQSLSGEESGSGEGATTFGSPVPLCEAGSEGPCARPARGSEGTHRRPGSGPRYSHVPSGNVCVGLGTTAAYVSPFAPEVAGVLVGVFLAARC